MYLRVGHYKSGSSDKVYVVRVTEEATDHWPVGVFFGKRLGSLQYQQKAVCATEGQARNLADDLFLLKMRKGYKDIDDSCYPASDKSFIMNWLKRSRVFEAQKVIAAPVVPLVSPNDSDKTMDGEELKEFLRKGMAEKSLPDGKDFVVVCRNDVGLEESFTEGTEYVAEKHSDAEMLWVRDGTGKKCECFRHRFEIRKGS